MGTSFSVFGYVVVTKKCVTPFCATVCSLKKCFSFPKRRKSVFFARHRSHFSRSKTCSVRTGTFSTRRDVDVEKRPIARGRRGGCLGMIPKDANEDTDLMQRILELAARHEEQVRTSARTRDAHAIAFVSPVCRYSQLFGRFGRPAAIHRHDPRLTATPPPPFTPIANRNAPSAIAGPGQTPKTARTGQNPSPSPSRSRCASPPKTSR